MIFLTEHEKYIELDLPSPLYKMRKETQLYMREQLITYYLHQTIRSGDYFA